MCIAYANPNISQGKVKYKIGINRKLAEKHRSGPDKRDNAENLIFRLTSLFAVLYCRYLLGGVAAEPRYSSDCRVDHSIPAKPLPFGMLKCGGFYCPVL